MNNKKIITREAKEPNYSYALTFEIVNECNECEFADNSRVFKGDNPRSYSTKIEKKIKSIEKWLDIEPCTKGISKLIKAMANKVAITYVMENKNPYNEIVSRIKAILENDEYKKTTLDLLDDKLDLKELFYFKKKARKSFIYENNLYKLNFSIDDQGMVNVSEFILYPTQKEKEHIEGHYVVTNYFDGLSVTNFISRLKKINLDNLASEIEEHVKKIKYNYIAQHIVQEYIAYLIMQNSNETMGPAIAMIYAIDMNDINKNIKDIPIRYGLDYKDMSDVDTYKHSMSKLLISSHRLLKGNENTIVFPSYFDDDILTIPRKLSNLKKLVPVANQSKVKSRKK